MAGDLDEQVTAFRRRPLDDPGPFTFVAADALTIKVLEAGRVINAVVLVAIRVNADGRREVLGVKVATSETREAWNVFFADLVARALPGVGSKVRTFDPDPGVNRKIPLSRRASSPMGRYLALQGEGRRLIPSVTKPRGTVMKITRIAASSTLAAALLFGGGAAANAAELPDAGSAPSATVAEARTVDAPAADAPAAEPAAAEPAADAPAPDAPAAEPTADAPAAEAPAPDKSESEPSADEADPAPVSEKATPAAGADKADAAAAAGATDQAPAPEGTSPAPSAGRAENPAPTASSKGSDKPAETRTTKMYQSSASISGQPSVGQTLTGSYEADDFYPDVTFQWLVDGVPVPDENGQTFQPRAEDRDKTVTFHVTDGATEATSEGVVIGWTTGVQHEVKIVGAPTVGSTLTVQVPDKDDYYGDVAFIASWYVDGHRVTTGTSYTVQPDDVDESVSVNVIAIQMDGHGSPMLDAAGDWIIVETMKASVVAERFAEEHEVSILGDARAGETLTVKGPDKSDYKENVGLHLLVARDDNVVTTGTTYVVQPEDSGKHISVIVLAILVDSNGDPVLDAAGDRIIVENMQATVAGELVTPTDPTEPTDPTNPTDPTDPTDPVVDPTDPTDPTDPVVDPTDPTDPTDPVVDPTEPTDPVVDLTDPANLGSVTVNLGSPTANRSLEDAGDAQLASTGSEATDLLVVGGGALALGAAMLLGARNRKVRPAQEKQQHIA